MDDDWVVLSDSPAFRRICRRNGYVLYVAEQPWTHIDARALLVHADQMAALAEVVDLENRPWILIASDRRDAAEALRLGATDLLERPLSGADLERALQRIERRFPAQPSASPAAVPGSGEPTLDVPLTKGRRILLRPSNILFLEARGDLTHIHVAQSGQGKLASVRNIGYWEEQLAGEHFVRIHRKYMVNITHVDNLSFDGLHLAQNLLPIAKRRRREVERLYHTFQLGGTAEI